MCNYNPINSHSHKHAVWTYAKPHGCRGAESSSQKHTHIAKLKEFLHARHLRHLHMLCARTGKEGQWHVQGQSITILLGVPLLPEVVITTKLSHTVGKCLCMRAIITK